MAEKFYSFKSYKSLDVTTLGFMCYSQKDIPISREIAWIQHTVCVNRTVRDSNFRLYDNNYGLHAYSRLTCPSVLRLLKSVLFRLSKLL